MQNFIYVLSCAEEDEPEVEHYLVSNRPLDLEKAVKAALKAMTYEEIVKPSEDWFEATIDKVCEMQGCRRLVPNGEYEMSDAYWEEHSRKEEDTSDFCCQCSAEIIREVSDEKGNVYCSQHCLNQHHGDPCSKDCKENHD